MGKSQSSFPRLAQQGAATTPSFSEAELEQVKLLFSCFHGPDATQLSCEQLEKRLEGKMTPEMSRRLFKAMRVVHISQGGQNSPSKGSPSSSHRCLPHYFSSDVSFHAFQLVLASLLNGSLLQKTVIVRYLMGGKSRTSVDSVQLMKFLQDLIRAQIYCIELNPCEAEVSLPRTPAVAIERLALFLLGSLLDSAAKYSHSTDMATVATSHSVHDAMLFVWLKQTPLVVAMLNSVLITGFPELCQGWRQQKYAFLPRMMPVDALRDRLSILDVPSIMHLSSHLPGSPEDTLWTLLYNTKMHEPTFNYMVNVCCKTQQPTLIVLEDTDGYVFGGYAADKWTTGPDFKGNSRCFVFSLVPFTRLCSATGLNENYMYLNDVAGDELPCCLAFGGQMGFFALSILPEFGHGTSCAASTFNSPQLSSQPKFTFKNLEIWAITKFDNAVVHCQTDGDEGTQQCEQDFSEPAQ